ADQYVDPSEFELGLYGCEAGHGREEGYANSGDDFPRRHRIMLVPGAGFLGRSAIEGFFVRIIELKPAGPGFSRGHPFGDYFDEYILHVRRRTLIPPSGSYVEIPPQEIGRRDRERDQIVSVDCHAGSLELAFVE